MKTFNLSVSFEEAQILGFALAKGYQENVSTTNEDGETVTSSPNPVSAADFCADYFTKFLAVEFSTIGMAQIMALKEKEKNEMIAGLQVALQEGITVTIE